MAIWYQAGVNPNRGWDYNRIIIFSNWVSITLASLAFITALVVWAVSGWTVIPLVMLLTTVALTAPLVFNLRGYIFLSRIWLCIASSAGVLSISLATSQVETDLPGEFQHLELRFVQLALSIIPLFIFKLTERKYWLPLMVINTILVLSYDWFNSLFGGDFSLYGLTGQSRYLLLGIFIVSFGALSAGAYFLRRILEEFETKTEHLVQRLSESNKQLVKQNKSIIHHEEELVRANRVIRDQQELLAREVELLNNELVAKNTQLTGSNLELMSRNNDLMQFSYTISHNLRGPVANLVGLLELLRKTARPGDRDEILNHVMSMVRSLDGTIKDLTSILDHRRAATSFKHNVVFQEEVEKIQVLLRKAIDDEGVVIRTDFSRVPEMLSVGAIIHSILYNLIYNAVKYRSGKRPSVVQVATSQEGDHVRIDVTDNGIGFDMKDAGQLFTLYKRLHDHIEGKGLGLFLVKLQAEALEGWVRAESKPDEGSTFTVFIKIPDSVPEHLVADSEECKVTYHAQLDSVVTVWHGQGEGFTTDALDVTKEFMLQYHVKGWIGDVSRRHGSLAAFQTACDELGMLGIERMAIVGLTSHADPAGLSGFIAKIQASFGLRVESFDGMDEAIQWMIETNQQNQTIKTKVESGKVSAKV